jgi:hypothetical protein
MKPEIPVVRHGNLAPQAINFLNRPRNSMSVNFCNRLQIILTIRAKMEMGVNFPLAGRANKTDIPFIQHFVCIKTVLAIPANLKIVFNFFLAMRADFHGGFS